MPDARAILAIAPTPALGVRLTKARIISALRKGGRQRRLEDTAIRILDAPRRPHKTDRGEQLGEWLYRQITRWRTGTLPAQKQAVLGVFGVCPGARRRGPRVAAKSA